MAAPATRLDQLLAERDQLRARLAAMAGRADYSLDGESVTRSAALAGLQELLDQYTLWIQQESFPTPKTSYGA